MEINSNREEGEVKGVLVYLPDISSVICYRAIVAWNFVIAFSVVAGPEASLIEPGSIAEGTGKDYFV